MRNFLLCVVLLVLGVVETSGNNMNGPYANRRIQFIAESLALEELPKSDTIMMVPSLGANKDVIFRFNKNNVLVHIGVSLFSDETKDMLERNICNFLERFFLELLIQGNKTDVCFKLNEYHIKMWINRRDYEKGNFSSFQEILNTMEMPVNFQLKHSNGRAFVSWTFGVNSLVLEFPLYRELIEGTDKKESDYELYNRLQGGSFIEIDCNGEEVNKKQLDDKGNGIYVRRGEKYRIKGLSSDSYYVKSGDNYQPLFHTDYPEYSLSNLFLTCEHGKGKVLQLAHRQYGHFTPEISIPLINFLEFLRKDFIVTCHTAYNPEGELETFAIFNHKTLDYIHMLRVRIKKEDLFGANPVLKGDFYTNIPQHYIKTLLK